MTHMYVVGEDALCCALGTRLVTGVKGWKLAGPEINTRGVTKLKAAISRYTSLAKVYPVLCVADTDRNCAVMMRESWLPAGADGRFLLRFAVTESESWLLADREGFADFLGVPVGRIPLHPDDVEDPKRRILALAARSRSRLIRQEVVSAQESSKPGSGYNVHLCDFVKRCWRPLEAAQSSPSLRKAIWKLERINNDRG